MEWLTENKTGDTIFENGEKDESIASKHPNVDRLNVRHLWHLLVKVLGLDNDSHKGSDS